VKKNMAKYAVSVNRIQKNIYHIDAKNKDEAIKKALEEWCYGIRDTTHSLHSPDEIHYTESEVNKDEVVLL